MFIRIIRTTIQGNLLRNRCCNGPLIQGNSLQRVTNVKEPNTINFCALQKRLLSSTFSSSSLLATKINSPPSLFSPPINNHILELQNVGVNQQTRSLTKFTRSRGKRRTVRTVLRRFYRLNWGIWIRTIAGRDNRLWKKRASRKRRIRQHVFCNSTQSWMLDKMVSPYWRKPKYWVDDPYNPYHQREEFWITRKKPKDF